MESEYELTITTVDIILAHTVRAEGREDSDFPLVRLPFLINLRESFENTLKGCRLHCTL